MLITSEAYKDNIFAQARQFASKLDFTVTNVVAQQSATVTASSETTATSSVSEILLESAQSSKYITNELNYVKLDGTFLFPPITSSAGRPIGWISFDYCDSNREFGGGQPYGSFKYGEGLYQSAKAPKLTIAFSSDQDILGLSIKFDVLGDSYATDFDITITYGSSSYGGFKYGESKYTSGTTIQITNNDSPEFSLNAEYVGVSAITISFTKMNAPYRNLKITSLSIGPTLSYSSKDILELNLLEEIKLDSSSLPANELSITLLDKNRIFDIINPLGIYSFLQRKQKLETYLGLKVNGTFEYVRTGIHFLESWKSKDKGLEAEFLAYDVFLKLSQSTFYKSVFKTANLKSLAEEVLIDAGVTNFVVDSALAEITVSGYLDIMTHRNALRKIAVAGMSVCYQDRFGYFQMKQLNTELVDNRVSFSNSEEYPEIEQLELFNKFIVGAKSYDSQVTTTIASVSSQITSTVDILIDYATFPASNISVSVTGATSSLNTYTVYSSAALLNITAEGTVSIVIEGQEQLQASTQYILDNVQVGEQEYVYTVDNTLITDVTIAKNVANWLNTVNQRRKKHSANYRQNPAIELGDTITFENAYTSDREVIVTKQEFEYDGALDGRVEGVES